MTVEMKEIALEMKDTMVDDEETVKGFKDMVTERDSLVTGLRESFHKR